MMKKEEIELFKGFQVRISLRNGFTYTGTINEFFTESFSLRDIRTGARLLIAYSAVEFVMEVPA